MRRCGDVASLSPTLAPRETIATNAVTSSETSSDATPLFSWRKEGQAHCSVALGVKKRVLRALLRRRARSVLTKERTAPIACDVHEFGTNTSSETCLPGICDRQTSLRHHRTAASPSWRHGRPPPAKLTTLQQELARFAAKTACGREVTAERAEDAEKEGSMNRTPRLHDEPSNDARRLHILLPTTLRALR